MNVNEKIKYNSKNLQIQVLRAIFCFVIIFYHYTFRYSQIYSNDSIFNNAFVSLFGQIGVISFFILSGFFLVCRREMLSIKEKVVYWLKRFLSLLNVFGALMSYAT